MDNQANNDRVIPIPVSFDLIEMRKKAVDVIDGTENKWEALKIITSTAFNCIMQIDKSLPGETKINNMIGIMARSTALYGASIDMINELVKYATERGMRDQMDDVLDHIKRTGITVREAYDHVRQSKVS